MPGETQGRVRRTMLEAGGYWRPLAAVARLLEELGELSELLARTAAAHDELAGELADLWIITAALADQYLAEVPEPTSAAPPGDGADALEPLAAAVAAAGEIARVVNYYDGPKTPRALAALPTLAVAVPSFHRRLGLLAGSSGVDLATAVARKLDLVHATDMERFGPTRSDPSTAPVLDRLRAAEPETIALRLWGAPESDAAHALGAFLKACGPERLDAFVVEGELPGGLDPERGLDPEGGGVSVERRGGFLLLRRRMLSRPGDDPA